LARAQSGVHLQTAASNHGGDFRKTGHAFDRSKLTASLANKSFTATPDDDVANGQLYLKP
jgi:hypothetical protein